MNKLAKLTISSLLVLLIIVIVAFVVVINVNQSNSKAEEEPNIDDIVEYSYESPEITTNLEDGNFVRIQFQLVTNGEEAKEELEKREFQVKNILIKELTTMTEEDFQEGLSDLEEELVSKVNEVMTDGEVTDVYTINKIMQ